MKRLVVSALIMVISSFLCGFTLFSGDISDAKKVTLSLGNKRIEAGNLIDDYKYFKNVEWSEEKQDDGSTIISATAEYDAKLHFRDRETKVSKYVSDEKNTEILKWINTNLDSNQSIAPIYVKFYFSRYTYSALQRDYIARIYANMPHVRDEIFQKMKSNKMSISPFYEIFFAQNPYDAKQSTPYKHPSPGNLFSLEALGEMLQQKPISEVNEGIYFIFLDYERHSRNEIERKNREALNKKREEIQISLNKAQVSYGDCFIIYNENEFSCNIYILNKITLEMDAGFINDFVTLDHKHLSYNISSGEITEKSPGDIHVGLAAEIGSISFNIFDNAVKMTWDKSGHVDYEVSSNIYIADRSKNYRKVFTDMCLEKIELKEFSGRLVEGGNKFDYKRPYLLKDINTGETLLTFEPSKFRVNINRDFEYYKITGVFKKGSNELIAIREISAIPSESRPDKQVRLRNTYINQAETLGDFKQLREISKTVSDPDELAVIESILDEYNKYARSYGSFSKEQLENRLQKATNPIEIKVVKIILDDKFTVNQQEVEKFKEQYHSYNKLKLQNMLNRTKNESEKAAIKAILFGQ